MKAKNSNSFTGPVSESFLRLGRVFDEPSGGVAHSFAPARVIALLYHAVDFSYLVFGQPYLHCLHSHKKSLVEKA
jgi:hypothetical protein